MQFKPVLFKGHLIPFPPVILPNLNSTLLEHSKHAA